MAARPHSKRGHHKKHAHDREPTEPRRASVAEDDRIIVFGGLGGTGPHGTTEVIESVQLRWQPGPVLGTQRWGCAAAAVTADDDVFVLVAGGHDGAQYLDTTEIVHYREDDRGCKPGPCLHTPRAGCTAVQVDRRRVLVIGGYDLDSTEVFDLATETFAAGPRLSTPRACCAAVMLDRRWLLVIGGFDRSGCSNTTELLDLDEPLLDAAGFLLEDLSKATFRPGPRLEQRRAGCAAAKITANHVLVVGGFDGIHRTKSTEMLDISDTRTMAFTAGPPMITERSGCTLARLDGQCIIVAGGKADCGTVYEDSTEMLNMEAMEFVKGPRMAAQRAFCTALFCPGSSGNIQQFNE